MNTGNAVVDQIGEISITGNVIPHSWYQSITYPSGKPYLTAIVILADIVYWYRPTEVRDEATGRVRCYRKKFRGDFLQRSYESIADQFGVSKREAKNAIVALEELGVVKRYFRTVQVGNLPPQNNVLFIDLIPEGLRRVTFQDAPTVADESHPCDFEKSEGHLPNATPPLFESHSSFKEINKEINKEIIKGGDADASPNPQPGQPAVKPSKHFQPPTVQEVEAYCADKGYSFDPDHFVAYYESVGWRVGNRPMRNWRAACVTWQKRQQSQSPGQGGYPRTASQAPKTIRSGSYDIDLDQYRGKSMKLSEYAAQLAAEATEKEI